MLYAIILIVIFYVIYLLYKAQKKATMWGLSLIVGGALGNLLDRALYGGVIDFIDLYAYNYHWPAFNLADSFIFIGAVIYMIDSFKGTK